MWHITPPDGPAEREAAPRPRRLAGVCAWAAMLSFLGVAVGIRGLIAILVKAPAWYEPTLIVLGLLGIAFAVGAILTVQYRRVPWGFLALSSGVLLIAIVATAKAT